MQNPIPQLKVLSISLSSTPLFFNQLNIFFVLILLRSISAESVFGITLLILSTIPPPVICAHHYQIAFMSFKISFT